MLLLSLVSTPHPPDEDARQATTSGIWNSCGLLISEFYPCALAGDEYFSLSVNGDSYVCLRNWSVTDGEGEIKFVSDLWVLPGYPFTVSFNKTSFWRAYDRLPDLSLDSEESLNKLKLSGTFRLADSGDSLTLLSPDGAKIDFVAYGENAEALTGWAGFPIASLRKGEVAKRISMSGRFVDSDCASDWQPFREFRYGFTDFTTRVFEVVPGAVTAFASPDCSLDVVMDAIARARESIHLCSYELSSTPICRALIAASKLGVDVHVLVDGAPAGNMGDAEVVCLSALHIGGCNVMVLNGNLSRGVVQHVGALHSKYIVIDSYLSLVASENFVEQGFPQDRLFGNRGWGVLIDNPALALHLQGLFDADARRTRDDVADWVSDPRFNSSATVGLPFESNYPHGIAAPFVSSCSANVKVFASPDSSPFSPFLCDMFNDSRSLEIEQFQADLFWTSRWTGGQYLNPIVDALKGSARSGAHVRTILDSSWFNEERNLEVLESLRANSSSGSSLQSQLMDSRSPISSLHNKGMIVDRSKTLVSSNNWVAASFAKNRELALLVESDEIASYFLRIFDLDWYPDEIPPSCDAGPDRTISLGSSAVIRPGNCTDDRIIASYEWDINADGTIESRAESLLFNATVPGRQTIALRVVDSWCNTCADELVVTVSSPSMAGVRRGHGLDAGPFWSIPAIMGLAYVLTRILRGRRRRGAPSQS